MKRETLASSSAESNCLWEWPGVIEFKRLRNSLVPHPADSNQWGRDINIDRHWLAGEHPFGGFLSPKPSTCVSSSSGSNFVQDGSSERDKYSVLWVHFGRHQDKRKNSEGSHPICGEAHPERITICPAGDERTITLWWHCDDIASLKTKTPIKESGRYARARRKVPPLPANTCLTLETAGIQDDNATYLFEPSKCLPPDLIIQRTLVTPSKGVIYLKAYNMGGDVIQVRPRQKLGILSPAKPATVNLIVENETQTNVSGMVPTFDLNRLQQDPSAPEEERKAIRRLVAANADVFSLSDDQMGCTGLLKHRIILTTDTPTSLLYRRIPPSMLQEERDHLDSLLSQDVITPSSSPYAAPIVLLRKKSGELRMCCDYRRLNAITRRDAFPIPRMEECIDALEGAKYFSTLDLASGFHQVEMAAEDREKTAFLTPFGLYAWKRLPFGLANAPAHFSRHMQRVMSDHLFQILLIYLDDRLVYSATFDEHLNRL